MHALKIPSHKSDSRARKKEETGQIGARRSQGKGGGHPHTARTIIQRRPPSAQRQGYERLSMKLLVSYRNELRGKNSQTQTISPMKQKKKETVQTTSRKRKGQRLTWQPAKIFILNFSNRFFLVGWCCPCFLPSLSSPLKETIIYEFPQTHEKISHKDTEKIRLLATPWKTLKRSQNSAEKKINEERKVNWRSFIAKGKCKKNLKGKSK